MMNSFARMRSRGENCESACRVQSRGDSEEILTASSFNTFTIEVLFKRFSWSLVDMVQRSLGWGGSCKRLVAGRLLSPTKVNTPS